MLPVVFVAPRPDHDIDAGTTPEHLAHVEGNGAAVQVRVGLRRETPVTVRTQIGGPCSRGHNLRNFVASSGFEQQDRDVRILRQTRCNNCARRTGAADNKIIDSTRLPIAKLLVKSEKSSL